MEKENDLGEQLPNYYTVIPANVRYDRKLSPMEVLLYGEIASLTNARGYCWATNKHFAKLLGYKSTTHISKMISKLDNRRHINVAQMENEGNKRYIYLVNPIMKNHNTSSENSVDLYNNKKENKNNVSLTDEQKKDIRKIYGEYLKAFFVDPRDWDNARSDEERSSLLDEASKRHKLTDKRKAKVVSRLKDCGFDMVVRAIRNCGASSFHRGDNDTGWSAKLDWICDSYEKIEEWANKKQEERW